MRRLGTALLDVMKKGGAPDKKTHMRGLALSENDVKIVSYLSRRPCSLESHLVAELKISRASVKWHLRKLVKAGLVASRLCGRRERFCPAGLLRDNELDLFSMLSSSERREMFRQLADAPGQTQAEVAAGLGASRQSVSKVMAEFTRLGLAVENRDGRHVRYYPSELLAIGGEAYSERRKPFLDGTVSKLATMGLRPRIIKSEPAEVHIILGERGRQATLRLGLNPYLTVFWE